MLLVVELTPIRIKLTTRGIKIPQNWDRKLVIHDLKVVAIHVLNSSPFARRGQRREAFSERRRGGHSR